MKYRNAKEIGFQHTNRMPCNRLQRMVHKSTDQKAEAPGETTEETSRSLKAGERVKKWPNCVLSG
jgi:hypothetical protein